MPGTVHIANKIWTLTHCLVGEKKKKRKDEEVKDCVPFVWLA
jgi:hypothetical protein